VAVEVYENGKVGAVKDSGFYLAEENLESFVEEVLAFIED
jgi:hypothetical protein